MDYDDVERAGCRKHDIDFYVGCDDCHRAFGDWLAARYMAAAAAMEEAEKALRRHDPRHTLLVEPDWPDSVIAPWRSRRSK